MFKINESVIHCREGLSTIISMSTINDRDYFLVRTHQASEETIYVPVASAESIIRPVLEEKAADDVLRFIKGIKKEFNTNTKQRRDAYKRRLSVRVTERYRHSVTCRSPWKRARSLG